MRVAIVDEEFPYPVNSGKRIRTLNLVKRLAQTHDVRYIAHQNADDSELAEAIKHFAKIGIKTTQIPRKIQVKSGFQFYAKLGANLLSPLPYSVSSHTSQAMRREVERLDASGEIDLWHCEWTPYAELFRGLNTKPLVIAAHNVESLIWQRYTESEANPIKRWYIKRQWRKFETFERWAFARATRTIMVSEPDAILARNRFGADNLDVVENGVDVQKYQSLLQERNPKEMIFLGSLDWRPNLDGLSVFLETVMPELAKRKPDLIFSIIGRKPPEWLIQRAESDPQIHLHADVPEVLPYLSRAGLMVVPLRVGGGSRLKIIEAAANGLPVVSTRVGAEGLEFQPAKDYFASESIETLAEPILKALDEPQLALQTAQHAKQLAEQQYDWDTLAQRQAASWEMAVGAQE